MQICETRDQNALRELLLPNAGVNGYLLGDLESPYFEQSRWFGASRNNRLLAVVLLYEGLAEPCLLSAGAPDGVAAIFAEVGSIIPPEGWAKTPAAHRQSWQHTLALSQLEHQWMMVLQTPPNRQTEHSVQVRKLSQDDADSIESIFEFYPGNFFEASQLANGCYVGAFEEEKLVSIAGTHVHSLSERTAVVANVVTHSAYRGRGLAGACLQRLIDFLHADGIRHISLQVSAANAAAIACYRRLGFAYASDTFQARYAVKRGPADA